MMSQRYISNSQRLLIILCIIDMTVGEQEICVPQTCMTGVDDVLFGGISRERCMNECKARDFCVGVSYHGLARICKVHGPSATQQAAESCGEYCYSDRATWQQQILLCDDADCDQNRATCITGEVCLYTDCPAPRQSNGPLRLLGNLRSIGTKVAYMCSGNYKISGTRSLTCQSDGTWSDSFPICDAVPTTTSTTTTTTPATTIPTTTTPATTTTTASATTTAAASTLPTTTTTAATTIPTTTATTTTHEHTTQPPSTTPPTTTTPPPTIPSTTATTTATTTSHEHTTPPPSTTPPTTTTTPATTTTHEHTTPPPSTTPPTTTTTPATTTTHEHTTPPPSTTPPTTTTPATTTTHEHTTPPPSTTPPTTTTTTTPATTTTHEHTTQPPSTTPPTTTTATTTDHPHTTPPPSTTPPTTTTTPATTTTHEHTTPPPSTTPPTTTTTPATTTTHEHTTPPPSTTPPTTTTPATTTDHPHSTPPPPTTSGWPAQTTPPPQQPPTTTTGGGVVTPCPSGSEWIHYGESCYFMGTAKLAAYDAWNQYCPSRYAKVSIPNTLEENQFIKSLLSGSEDRWVGIALNTTSGTWVDAMSGNSLPYADWPGDVPTSSLTPCAVYSRLENYKWKAVDCLVQHHVVCEKPAL